MVIKVRLHFVDDTPNRRRSWSVPGLEVPFDGLSVGDVTNRVAETEAYLSRLTGLKVTIDTDTLERKHT